MLVLPPYLIEPIWQQFSSLIPERQTSHPLECHRPRIPDRVSFSEVVIIVRRLIREGRTRYRWEGRPSRRR